MHRAIQPLPPGGRRVVGTAVTLAIAGPDSTLLHHAAGLLRPGDILVVDRLGDDKYACWGGGVTVAVRRRAPLPASSMALAPIWPRSSRLIFRSARPHYHPHHDLGGGMNVPVSCGGAVMPGDAILADESGVLVIPRDEALAVAEQALTMQGQGARSLGARWPRAAGSAFGRQRQGAGQSHEALKPGCAPEAGICPLARGSDCL